MGELAQVLDVIQGGQTDSQIGNLLYLLVRH